MATQSELLDYIFKPGFSTAAEVTDISGRGVGLDVVRTNLKKAKGEVSVHTNPNNGTCFRLTLPLTMAVMRALLLKSGQAIYAISLQDISETVKINYDQLKSIRQKSAISLRGEVIMVEPLSRLLGHAGSPIVIPDERISILILQRSGKKIGIMVDSIFSQQEIVVKPLPDAYSGLQGLAGVSILGDGRAILILDSCHFYDLMLGRTLASVDAEPKLFTEAA